MKLSKIESKRYLINRKDGESVPEFYTRVANELQTMKVKIIGFGIGSSEAFIDYFDL